MFYFISASKQRANRLFFADVDPNGSDIEDKENYEDDAGVEDVIES